MLAKTASEIGVSEGRLFIMNHSNYKTAYLTHKSKSDPHALSHSFLLETLLSMKERGNAAGEESAS